MSTLRIREPRSSTENRDHADTSNCPISGACELCGADTELVVIAVDVPLLGAGCLTICPSCRATGDLGQIPIQRGARMVLAHYAHLGYDVPDVPAPTRHARSKCTAECVVCGHDFYLDASPSPLMCWVCDEAEFGGELR